MKYFTKEMEERFFIGVELLGGVSLDKSNKIEQLWTTFFTEDMKLLNENELTHKFIGLECYPPDFMETREFDYYAMVETKGKIKQAGFTTKKLPKGNYIFFEVNSDTLSSEIKNVYRYVKENSIKVHMGFDFEDYIKGQDYGKEGAMLNFALLLEDD